MLLPASQRKRILLLGATGTIGRATLQTLSARGYDLTCFIRSGSVLVAQYPKVTFRTVNLNDTQSITQDGFRGETFDAVISCLASRTGSPDDAWAIDHRAHMHLLAAAQAAGVGQFVLLSAICVQKPLLAFQHAKLAFEQELAASGMTHSIVRPTAFFKSLSGQVERVKKGKPFLLFGDGELTACKPISDADLANYLVECIDNPVLHNRILPIGGPGEAITPRQQGEMLFALLGQEPRFRQVPVKLLDGIVATLGIVGRVVPAAARKAELARIGRYYAAESMLVWNAATGQYDAASTPSTGSDTLQDHYARMIRGEAIAGLGEHALF